MKPKSRLSKFRLLVALALIIGSVVLARVFTLFHAVESLQLKSVDSFFKLRGTVQPTDTSIVVVGIDDATFNSLEEKWPYPGSYYSQFVRNLSRAGARAIVFDIEFFEANAARPEEDFNFSDAIRDAGNVILAGKVLYQSGKYGLQFDELLRPNAWFIDDAVSWGTVNSIEDPDGFIRQYVLFQEHRGEIYYPLAIEAYKFLENPTIPVEANRTGSEFILGERRIPKIAANTMMINYGGPPEEAFRTYSFSSILDDANFDLKEGEDTDVFENHLTWETFKDKIVFVGAFAEDLQDTKFTPFYSYNGERRKMAGVETHAHALSTIMRGNFLSKIDPFIEYVLLIIMVAIAALGILFLKPYQATILIIAEIVMLRLGGYYAFLNRGEIVDIITPMIGVLFSFMSGLVYIIIVEQRDKARIRKIFIHYMSPEIVKEMIDSGSFPQFGGERRELTVLFSDIRKFSAFSEKHEPEHVVNRLSDYLSAMVDVIFNNRGTVDKFVGDAVMALFGAPHNYPEHAEFACKTALEMMAQLDRLKNEWAQSAVKDDFEFDIGIGINTGSALVGNLGSHKIFDYTVIGNEVNLGARLEGANKIYGTSILISENTYRYVKDKVIAREIDYIRVVGIQQPVRIYELLALTSLSDIKAELLINTFAEGLEAYRNHRWGDALKIFRRILNTIDDGPSELYTRRCLDCLETPPSADWDGVHDLKQK
jgi:adenylate cyclase